jgi:hypothetical protein
MVVDGGKRAGQVGHIHLGQETELAEVHPQHRRALPVGQPHGAQHRAVPAETDHQVRAPAEFGGRDSDRGAVQPFDLRVDAQHLGTLARSPVQDGGHRRGGISRGVQDKANGLHLRSAPRAAHGWIAWP